MHLLYLDDAGSAANKSEDYLVLGGISVFEAQSSFLTSELDKIATGFSATNPQDVEFHASEVFARRAAPWGKLGKEEAKGVLKAVLGVLAASYDSAKAFACVVHKASYPGRDPLQLAFEDLCSRFDRYLSRLHAAGDRQRGMIILDESSHETTLQGMARNFRSLGTQWGVIRNLAETPLFVNSKASRCVQLADHVAYAVFRRYQSGDTSYFDIIASRFDTHEGVMHGLSHKQSNLQNCMCPACMSRRFARIES
jgi:hypothetical protein